MSVQFHAVQGFDQLPINEVTAILYDELVPACEAKGVQLSQYGNHNGVGSLKNDPNEYDQKKQNNQLFEVAKVQEAYQIVQQRVANRSTYFVGSYGLKHQLEEIQGGYFSNGDTIAAMLLNGYTARFAKRGKPLGVNCQFKAKVIG